MDNRDFWESSLEAPGAVLVFNEVTSTQDAAIAGGLVAGDVCTALIQTKGRGRQGNQWNSEGGIAVTVVLNQITSILPIAVGATLAAAINNALPEFAVGIKWPNDIMVEGKKLAGILIEEQGNKCLVGVGLNVLEPPTTNRETICMVECGYKGGRINAVQLVINSVFSAAQINSQTAVQTWKERDVLIGTRQTVSSKGEIYTGLVIDIVPGNHLLLQTKSEIITLNAETAKFLNQ